MKAIITKIDDQYAIKLLGSDGRLCDIFIVETLLIELEGGENEQK